ncbi:MAG: AAA family ATPase [Actinocatenispora sp.]
MRVLVLTGPPAVGKTTIGRLLAAARPRCALVDVDDVRHMVVSGHSAPWDGDDGRTQQALGVLNGCALANNFTGQGIDVVIVDVLTEDTAARYRQLLPDPLVVQLTVSYPEALRRAHTRPVHLSWDEFRQLHDQHARLTAVDVRVDTTGLGPGHTAARLSELWAAS